MTDITNLMTEISLEHDKNITRRQYYYKDFSLHERIETYFSEIVNYAPRQDAPLSRVFEELAEYYLMSGLYAIEFCDSNHKTNELLSTASYYSYGLLVFFNKKCTGTHSSMVLMRKAVYLWSSLFLVGWDNKAMRVGSELIDSLNKKGSIIRYGNRLTHEAWFLLELYSLAFDKPFNKDYVDYPETMKEYEIILEKWDTKHLTLVNDFVSVLCDAHFKLENIDEYELDDEYMNFYKSIMKLYPYTVIGFLAIRKQAGLKNPKTFTHPLMNTPIAKMFLDIKEPLPYPTELPYAKELLEKLKEQCPNVEIPEWLEGNDEKTPTSQQSENILPEDFME